MTSGEKKNKIETLESFSQCSVQPFSLCFFSSVTEEVKEKNKLKKERMENREVEEENRFLGDLVLSLQQGPFL